MTKKINVLHSIFTIDLNSGGPARSMPVMCMETEKNGVRNTILTYNSPSPNSELLNRFNIPVLFVEPESNGAGRRLSLSYRKALNHLNSDIFHLHSLWSLPLHWAFRRGRKNKIPVIISPRGTLEPATLSQKRIKKRFAMALYQKKDLQRAACIHATAPQEAENIRKLGIRTPIAVIPNGINLEAYPMKGISEYDTEKGRTILFLSRIHPKKGIELLLQAWHAIEPGEKENWRLVIAGDGDPDYIRQIEKLIDQKYPDSGVAYAGPRYGQDKVALYHAADLFVLPTYSENFGMVIAEAMACGVPVITTTGTPWKILEEEKAGWWVDNTVGELKKAISQGLRLPEDQRAEMGRRGRQIIEREFSIEKVAHKYVELYEWVLDKSKTTPTFIQL